MDVLTHAQATGSDVATKKIILLRPRGFCAGVVRAIDVVKIVLDLYGAPVYVRKEIVHNKYVIRSLAAKGAVFIDELDVVRLGNDPGGVADAVFGGQIHVDPTGEAVLQVPLALAVAEEDEGRHGGSGLGIHLG